jgi:antitoxin FitA
VSNIQVKHVDPEIHQQLRERCAAASVDISTYVLELIRRDLARPLRSDWLRHIAEREGIGVTHDEVISTLAASRAES